MEHSEKVEVIPKDTNFKKYTDKLTKLLKIILKLARINGYDVSGRIKSKNGDFIENSNLIQLFNNAMMSSRVLVGEKDFIRLLFEANVEPDLITNDNVRVKLLQLYNASMADQDIETKVTEKHSENAKPIKRKINDEGDSNDYDEPNAKRFRSEVPKLTHYRDIPLSNATEMPTLTPNSEEDNEIINSRKRKRTWIFPDDD